MKDVTEAAASAGPTSHTLTIWQSQMGSGSTSLDFKVRKVNIFATGNDYLDEFDENINAHTRAEQITNGGLEFIWKLAAQVRACTNDTTV